MSDFSSIFLGNASKVLQQLDFKSIETLANNLHAIREKGGRLFICGLGGSAGNASHAVNDFRKLCNLETYSPTDNISELTARVNDEGAETIFFEYLRVSNFNRDDAVLILSVGGGSYEPPVSVSLIKCIEYAKKVGGKVFGIVGRNGGATKELGDCVVLIPNIDNSFVTPVTESLTALIWHCLVSHPILKANSTKW
jgi:D-sedoheptulose 7-phosphate isomerase